MVICSTRPPLTALAALVFGLLLASASQEPYPPPHSPSHTPRLSLQAPSQSHTPRQGLPISPRPPRSPPPSPRRPRHPPPSQSPPASINYSPPPRKPIQGSQPLTPLLTSKTTRKTLNLGKKLGLSFAGIAVILQFAVAGFLAYKKKQLYRVQD